MAHPPWPDVLRQTVWPDFRAIHVNQVYVFMVINLIGTTITPWGQFYIQSSVRDKSIRPEEYKITRADVLFGGMVKPAVPAKFRSNAWIDGVSIRRQIAGFIDISDYDATFGTWKLRTLPPRSTSESMMAFFGMWFFRFSARPPT